MCGGESGVNGRFKVAKMAISWPLLEVSIDGARGVLFNVSGGADMAMAEINEAARVITEHIDPDAKVIFGAVIDDKLKKGEIKVTVVATGFNNGHASSAKPTIANSMPSLFGKNSGAAFNNNSGNSASANGMPTTVKELVDSSVSDDADAFDIPAFIRRKMK